MRYAIIRDNTFVVAENLGPRDQRVVAGPCDLLVQRFDDLGMAITRLNELRTHDLDEYGTPYPEVRLHDVERNAVYDPDYDPRAPWTYRWSPLYFRDQRMIYRAMRCVADTLA